MAAFYLNKYLLCLRDGERTEVYDSILVKVNPGSFIAILACRQDVPALSEWRLICHSLARPARVVLSFKLMGITACTTPGLLWRDDGSLSCRRSNLVHKWRRLPAVSPCHHAMIEQSINPVLSVRPHKGVDRGTKSSTAGWAHPVWGGVGTCRSEATPPWRCPESTYTCRPFFHQFLWCQLQDDSVDRFCNWMLSIEL